MKISLADLRENYTKGGLLKQDLRSNPFDQFQKWLEEAVSAEVLEPNAMTLATIDERGRPTARIVLLKKVDDRGFIFFTNYSSRKGQNIAENPYASLVFWWGDLERQIRIEGTVEKISDSESDDYFYSRPISSQLGAWASPQSDVVADRQFLEDRLAQITEEYLEQKIPRPSHWGGYRVVPDLIEFWQGRESRLHDRLCYSLDDNDNWQIDRLAP